MPFFSVSKKIILSIIIILGLLGALFFFWFALEEERFLVQEMKNQAQAIYYYIDMTRQWISGHGGIYVKKENHFLLLTPSHFTKEIATFAQHKIPYQIRVAVINAQNPNHRPDEFEKEAIRRLQNGQKEVWKIINAPEPIFRYAAPLRFSQECLSCHSEFKNNIQGCISIGIPATNAFKEFRKKKFFLGVYIASTLVVVLAGLIVVIRFFLLDPLEDLIDAFRRVEEGDLKTKISLERGQEWRRLAKSFNRMVEKLASHQKELEIKIQEATQELKSAYEELKRIERYKSEFFSNITHDLKTPLTSIKLATEILMRKDKRDDPQLFIIQKNTEKLTSMINNLLNYSKIESGRIELNIKREDLIELLDDVIFTVQPLAQDKGVRLELKAPETPVMVPFDKERMFQVFLNLLANAVKFSPREASVVISVDQRPDSVVVSVEDYGPGIPEEEWPRIFEKFYRGSETKSDGMGLGLAICRGILQAHGGEIWISKPNHAGIIFNVRLPLRSDNE